MEIHEGENLLEYNLFRKVIDMGFIKHRVPKVAMFVAITTFGQVYSIFKAIVKQLKIRGLDL